MCGGDLLFSHTAAHKPTSSLDFCSIFFPTADNFVAKSLYWSLSPSPGVLVLVYLLLPLTESLLFLSLPTPNSPGSPGPTLSVRDAQHRVLGCLLGLNLIPFP